MSKRTPPPEAHELGGLPTGVYKGSLIYRRYMAIGLFLIVGSYGVTQAGSAGILGMGRQIWWALLGVELAILLIMILSDVSFRVWTFREGLVYAKFWTRNVVRWEEVAETWITVGRARGVGRIILQRYTLQLDSGDKVILDDRLRNIAKLGEIIKRETTRRLLPRAIERVNGGEAVEFGELSVTPEGVSGGERLIRWGDIASARADEERSLISILSRRKGGQEVWGSVHIPGTPNAYVLLALVKHFA